MVRNAILKMKFEIPNHTVQPIDKQRVQAPNIMKKDKVSRKITNNMKSRKQTIYWQDH